jgi:DNA helicase-2/ATP-dependent DNA helicase PcrA
LPSRFVEELPEAHVERSGERGLYGGGLAESKAAWNDPAWSRARFGQTRREAAAPVLAKPRESEGAFKTGQRVFHDKFGNGTVLSLDGNKLEIAFDKAGTKKVLDSFVSAV